VQAQKLGAIELVRLAPWRCWQRCTRPIVRVSQATLLDEKRKFKQETIRGNVPVNAKQNIKPTRRCVWSATTREGEL
jgi:hypothetical protein